MDKFKVQFNGAKLEGSYDGNADGEPSVALNIHLAEILDELNSKGEVEVEVKKLRLKKEGAKLTVELDPNQDGDAVLDIMVDGAEVLDEAI